MHTLSTREATGVFDPGNPGQRVEVYYAGWPGQYASFYTNEVPTTASVNLGAGVAGMSVPMQVGLVALLSLGAYFGTKKLLGGRRRRRR